MSKLIGEQERNEGLQWRRPRQCEWLGQDGLRRMEMDLRDMLKVGPRSLQADSLSLDSESSRGRRGSPDDKAWIFFLIYLLQH